MSQRRECGLSNLLNQEHMKLVSIENNTISFPYGYMGLTDGKPKELDFSAPLVRMAIDLEQDLKRFILSRIRSPLDVEDIYQDTILMLATKQLDLITEISLKKYIFGCANIAIKRYFSKRAIDQKMVTLMDDNKLNLSDIASDLAQYTIDEVYTEEDVISALDQLEGKRYKYGCDIYLILFVRLINPNLSTKDYLHIIALITGEDKKQLTFSYTGLFQDDAIMDVLSILLLLPNPVEILSPYVYCSDSIQRMLIAMKS